MSKMNVDAKKTAQTMKEFARQVEMSNAKEEMLDDALMVHGWMRVNVYVCEKRLLLVSVGGWVDAWICDSVL